MKLIQALCVLLIGVCCCTIARQMRPQEDLVKFIPGLEKQPSFETYSGYLNASDNIKLHYIFVESQSNVAKDPLVVWYNGGPGCSSMEGFFKEHGPYVINGDMMLETNDYAWNKESNMVYIEAPAGVGFSYAIDGNTSASDDTTSFYNYMALKNFFTKFPEFKSNELFITGESYGGVYVPTLASRVMDDESMNLKGIAVGNGLASYFYNDNSLLYFGKYHGLFSDALWDSMLEHCCPIKTQPDDICMFTKNTSTLCQEDVAKAQQIIGYGLNIYNLYSKCDGGVQRDRSSFWFEKLAKRPNGISKDAVAHKNLFRENRFVQFQSRAFNRLFSKGKLENKNLQTVLPCTDSSDIQNYLNNKYVRSVFHVNNDYTLNWQVCSEEVVNTYQRNYMEMSQQYNKLIAAKKYRILIYNGDIDMACNYLGDQWFFNNLKATGIAGDRQPWLYSTDDGNQIGGYFKHFPQSQVSLVTIRGAGHMVPEDKPAAAYYMISKFLKNEALQ